MSDTNVAFPHKIQDSRIVVNPVPIPRMNFPDPTSALSPAILAIQEYGVVRTTTTHESEDSTYTRFELEKGNIEYIENRIRTNGNEKIIGCGQVILKDQIDVFHGGMDQGISPWIFTPRDLDKKLPCIKPDSHDMTNVYPRVRKIYAFCFADSLKLVGGIVGGILSWGIAKKLVGRFIGGAAKSAGTSLLRSVGGFFARRLLPVLTGGFVGLAISCALFAYELSRLLKNIKLYRDFQDPSSQASNDVVDRLDREMRDRGFTVGKPASVTFFGHSGGGAIGTVLATRSNSENSGLAFRVKRLVLIASPLTKKHMENIPSNIETIYIEARNDKIFSFARSIGPIVGLNICQDIQKHEGINFHVLNIDGDHISCIDIDGREQGEEYIQRLVYERTRNIFTDEQLKNIRNEARLIFDEIFSNVASNSNSPTIIASNN